MKKIGSRLPITIAQAEMRAINRSAVLEYLRTSKITSRTEIANKLKLSRPTVMRIIDKLIEKGLVISTGKKESGIGRSRELLEINQKGNAVIGIDIGGGHISGALADIGGEIIFEHRKPQQWKTPDENYKYIENFILQIMEKSHDYKVNLLGIGIGVPGIVATKTGDVKLAPSLRWEDYPFLQKLLPLLDVPIFIENDVALAALGEHWFGAGIGSSNLIMITIGTGIGSGVILDGKLYRGHSDSAGEIGYMIPSIQYLNQQYPDFGALESIASGKGITDRAREILKMSQPNRDLSEINAQFVFDEAKGGKRWAIQLIDETIDHLSLMIANVSVCFDPEIIILGGGVAGSLDLLIDPIIKRLDGVIPNLPQLKISTLRDTATLLGGVVHVFHKITDYSVVHIA